MAGKYNRQSSDDNCINKRTKIPSDPLETLFSKDSRKIGISSRSKKQLKSKLYEQTLV